MKKIYNKPEITLILIDNEISLILCSDNDHHHGHHGHHMQEYEEENSDSPFY